MTLRLLAAVLLATTAMGGVAVAQSAQPVEQTAPAKKKQKPAAATPAEQKPAAEAKADPQAAKAKAESRVLSGMTASPTDFGTVFAQGRGEGASAGGSTGKDLGGGYMIEEETPKTRSTVTRDAIDKLSPTANPYQMIQMLPGALVTSTDASGLNGGNIQMRGFNSDQIGLTIEGAPVNDSGNYALYPQEYVDAENIEQVSIAQGSPDLDSPHIGSTGGVINVYMRDPSKERGGYVSGTVGSWGQRRGFIRFDTGQIENVRGYLSYSHNSRDHWNRLGSDDRDHVDAKIVWDLDAGNHVRAAVIYNSAINSFYPNPTLAQYNNGSWASIYHSARTSATDTAYIGYKVNPFRNAIVSLPSDFHITDDLTYDVVPYFWYGFGSGGGVSSMSEDDGTATTAQGRSYVGTTRLTNIDWNGDGVVTNGTKTLYYNPSITKTYRPGIINKFTYQLDDHKLVAGYWFESAYHRQTSPYQALNGNGEIQDVFLNDSDGVRLPDGTILQRRDWKTTTTTNMVFAGDTWTMLNDTLKFDYGVKQAFVNRKMVNNVPGATPSLSTNNAVTLPNFGVNWKFLPQHQAFANVSTSFRTTPNYSLADQFSSSTGALTNISSSNQDPETAVTLELGHRYQGEFFATSLSLFGTQYKNRQVQTSILDPSISASPITANLNAGSVTSYGLDFEIGTRPLFAGLRPYMSAELLRTRLNDNLKTTNTLGGNDYLPTAGKQMPRSPNFTTAWGIDYDDGHYFGRLAYKYIGRQYSTFMNDESIHDYGQVDASLGYRFGDIALGEKASVKKPELSLNLYNLANQHNLTGVNSVATNSLAQTGLSGNTIAAASAPNYYMSEGFALSLTFKAAF